MTAWLALVAVGGGVWLAGGIGAVIEFDVETPMVDQTRPVIINLLITALLWLPLLMIAVPIAGLARLALPSGRVNTKLYICPSPDCDIHSEHRHA